MNEQANIPKLRFPGFEGEWKTSFLSDITDKIGDGLHGTPDYTEDGTVFFINGNNIVNGKLAIHNTTKKVSETTFIKNDKKLNVNSLLICIRPSKYIFWVTDVLSIFAA